MANKKKYLLQGAVKMSSVDELIKRKYMIVKPEKYHAAVMAELWNLYTDEQKLHFCRNIVMYCNIQNSYDQLKPEKHPALLISIKDSANNVRPYCYFQHNTIRLFTPSRKWYARFLPWVNK